MLASIVRFSIRRRGVVLALAVVLMAYGGYQLSQAGLDIFPEFSPKLVIIQTEAPGYSAEQVEQLVTRPVEKTLAGVIGLNYTRSQSIQGLSVVNVFFKEDTDIFRDRQLVGERLASVSARLPPGAGPAVPVPLESSSATVLTIGVTSKVKSLMQLRDMVDWSIVPRILSLPGVADVNVFGGAVRQLQIQVLPEKLVRYGLSVQDVVKAARSATGIYGTGFIENSNQRMTLTVTGQPMSPHKLGEVILKRIDGANVMLKDVAHVVYGPAPPFGAASIMTKPGVVMMVIGQYGANTLNVSRSVEKVLGELKHILAHQGVRLYTKLFRPADYIETSIHNITGHLMIGGLFVVIVLFAVLFNIRTAFISALAIPLSMLGAVIVLLLAGVNLNIMVLGGLAIALGEVVDDAIIDTENIFRRLRENRAAATPQPLHTVVFKASMEVRGSVVYASFIVALVFVPLLTLGGVAGRLFSPLGYTYILAVLMSLAVALTVTPALCYMLLARGRLVERDPPLISWIKPHYGRWLHVMCARPRTVAGITLVFCAIGIGILPTLGTRFLPDLREGHYIVHVTCVPGTSLKESIRIGNQLTRRFLKVPGVRSVSQWAGRAARGADTYGSHYSEYEVDLKPMSGAGQQRVEDQLRGILAKMPGILYETNTFLIERVEETISGYTSPVVVNILGNDLHILDRKAHEVAAVMHHIKGASDVQIQSPTGTPMLQIRLKQHALNYWGLRPLDAINAVRAAYDGAIVGKVNQGYKIYNVAVILPPRLRRFPDQVARLPLRSAEGKMITLGNVADISETNSRYNVLHLDGQRVQTVTCHVRGRDLGSFMKELRYRVLTQIKFPADTSPEFTGAAVEQARARNRLIMHSLLAGMLVLILIYMGLGSVRHTAVMLVNLPFALVGGVFAVLLTGATISVGSMVGFVTLFGITVRNSIMLVSHYQHLVHEEGCEWGLDTVIRGAQERLPSIAMTALVTALAMLPMAFHSDNPGREIMGPMAAIIIGGLVSSTLLNLLVMPTIMLKLGRFGEDEE